MSKSCINRLQGLTASKEIPNDKQMSVGLSELCDLRPYIDKTMAAKDNRTFLKLWKKDELKDLPVLFKFIEFCREEFYEEIEDYKLYYSVGMFRGQTEIPGPSDDTVARFIFNIGCGEMYHLITVLGGKKEEIDEMLEKKLNIGNILSREERELYMGANTWMMLGTRDLCDYNILVKSVPPKERPQMLLTNNPMKKKSIPFRRMPRHHRITIVVDLLGDTEIIERATSDIKKLVERGNLNKLKKMGRAIIEDEDNEDDMRVTKKEKRKIKQMMKEDKTNHDEIQNMMRETNKPAESSSTEVQNNQKTE